MKKIEKIAFGGGCHWCTEGVFLSLIGIQKVEQGWIASTNKNESFSEAVIVHFEPKIISLNDLIEIHLYTHSSTSNHSRRDKYRSAVYTFSPEQKKEAKNILVALQNDFEEKIITQVLDFVSFKLNIPEQLNYFYSNTEKPFCETHIKPKLSLLMKKHAVLLNQEKIKALKL